MVEYTVERNVENWTENKRYAIKKGKKEVLRLSNEEEAKEVCDYLNKITSKSKKTSLKPKKIKEGAKKEKKE